jgi:hypothetical protein
MAMGGNNYDVFAWKDKENQGSRFHGWDLNTFKACDYVLCRIRCVI